MVDREARRAQRVLLKHPLSVSLRSIGSEVQYELTTADISDRGFFLAFENPGRFPFSNSSIIEVWLTIDDKQQVFFNGQMARIILPEDEAASVFGTGIAIKVVQITDQEQEVLSNFVKEKADEQEESRRTSQKAS